MSRSIGSEEKIENQKKVISHAKDKYEAEMVALEQLLKKRREL